MSVRCYLMFNFDWQKGGPWNESNIKGPQGWLQRCLEDSRGGSRHQRLAIRRLNGIWNANCIRRSP